ncbi:MAG: LacI family transcriptional regulator [Chloroflexi bacterium]|nr:LacI family transcriptional regulator [Chloroflexota bacterium]
MPAKMEDVARLAGVSTATVSRVLNNPELVSEATRQRVNAAIRQLDYRLNLAARSLRTSQTRTIAVVLPTIADPVINRMVEAIEDVAITAGYTLLLCSTRGDASREQAYIEFLTQQAYADGVLYISPRATPEQVMALARDEMPLVLCNYMVDVESVPCLLLDHVSSMYQTTAHLLSLGHCRIALLNLSAPHYYPARMRYEGFVRAYEDAEVPLDPSLCYEIDQPTYATPHWHAVIDDLLARPDRPTAIVAFNDEVALEVYAVCRQRGLRIPDDLAVTGCDDILSARHVAPPLTTVRVPAREQGERAMRALLKRLARPRGRIPHVTLLPVELVVRGSTAPLGQGVPER